jgi:hypothetical protein
VKELARSQNKEDHHKTRSQKALIFQVAYRKQAKLVNLCFHGSTVHLPTIPECFKKTNKNAQINMDASPRQIEESELLKLQ